MGGKTARSAAACVAAWSLLCSAEMLRSSHQLFRVICAVALLAAGAMAKAQAQEPQAGQLQFHVTPYLWIAGVHGTLDTPIPSLPAQKASAGFGEILSHLDAIPIMGAAEIRYDRFGLLTDFTAISGKVGLRTPGPQFSGGSVWLTQIVGTAIGAYRLLDSADQSLDLGIGVRAFGMSTKFVVNAGLLPGFTKTPGASWADPIGALRYHIDVNPRWGLTVYGDVGGGPNEDLTWQAMGTVDYRITGSTVLRIGFRHMQFQFKSGGFRQNIGMTGPIVGATFRF